MRVAPRGEGKENKIVGQNLRWQEGETRVRPSVRLSAEAGEAMTPQNTAKSTAAAAAKKTLPRTSPANCTLKHIKRTRAGQSSRSHSSESDGQVSPFSSPCFLRCGHSIVGGALLAQLGRLTIALTKLYVQETCSSDTDGFVTHATFGFPLFGRTVDFLVSLAIAVTLIRTRTAANGGREGGNRRQRGILHF